jgi:hypothetical protein
VTKISFETFITPSHSFKRKENDYELGLASFNNCYPWEIEILLSSGTNNDLGYASVHHWFPWVVNNIIPPSV